MNRPIRIAVVLTVLCAVAGALVLMRARKGWRLDDAEIAAWKCEMVFPLECVL